MRRSVHLEEDEALGGDEADAALRASVRANWQRHLFRWADFPLALPPPVRADGVRLTPADLFTFPQFEQELERLSVDAAGQPLALNEAQLAQIRENAEFDVASRQFPGKTHRWRLNLFLQKGLACGRQTYRQMLAWALELLIVTARDRLCGRSFSLWHAAKSICKLPRLCLDLLCGWPANDAIDSAQEYRKRLALYMIADLRVSPGEEAVLKPFKAFVNNAYKDVDRKINFSLNSDQLPTVPSKFIASEEGGELALDLRLHDHRVWIRDITPRLKMILDEQSQAAKDDWFLAFRNATVKELADEGLNREGIEARTKERIAAEFDGRVDDAILADQQLQDWGVADLLVAQRRVWLTAEKALRRLRADADAAAAAEDARLRRQHPILSLIGRWLEPRVAAAADDFLRSNRYRAYDELLEQLGQMAQTDGIYYAQAAYFLERYMSFEQSSKAALLAELAGRTEASRTFHWRRAIWSPCHYVVERVDRQTAESTVVPTVVVSRLHDPDAAAHISDKYRYELHRTVSWSQSTAAFGWRWANAAKRYVVWTLNSMFFLLLVVPVASPVGLRALLGWSAFYPDRTVDARTGEVCYSTDTKVHTMRSRWHALWRHVAESRRRFERAPDRGLLGKSVTRFFNRLWNYVFVGACGSVLLVVLMPLVCVVCGVGGVALGATAPVWMPLPIAVYHLFCLLVYDLDMPRRSSRSLLCCRRTNTLLDLLVCRGLLLCVLQPLAAAAALVACPLGAAAITAAAHVRCGVRVAWDSLVFNLLIRKVARVPALDTWVARRVAGPGLSADYMYQMKPAQALAVLECAVELDELEQWERQTRAAINEPVAAFEQRVQTILAPFGGALDTDNELYASLRKDSAKYEARLTELLRERRRRLKLDASESVRRKLRLTDADLQWTLAAGALLLGQLYPARVLERVVDRRQFWQRVDAPPDDWRALAAHMFRRLFGDEFLVPLEEGETRFELAVEHIDLKSYLDQLIRADFRDDLDAVRPTQVSLPRPSRFSLPEATVAQFAARPTTGALTAAARAVGPAAAADYLSGEDFARPPLAVTVAVAHNAAAAEDDRFPLDDSAAYRLLANIAGEGHF